ncbi:MAG: hypothetical protein ACRDZO_08595 [Egibacteraceae bacterium]
MQRLVDDWYRKLDEHAPFDEVLALVAHDGFEIQVPEGTFRGPDEFKRLYEEGWIRRFFDEAHKVKNSPSRLPAIPQRSRS